MAALEDGYTVTVDPARAAEIPALQRACRSLFASSVPEVAAMAEAVDAVLSWLDGDQSDSLLPLNLAAALTKEN